MVAHSALSPSLTLLMTFLAPPLSFPSSLLSCIPALCIFLTTGPIKMEPHVFLLLLPHSGAAARISCLWLCETVECLFSAEGLTMFTSIKLSFFPSIWEAGRMGQSQYDYSPSCLFKPCDQDVSSSDSYPCSLQMCSFKIKGYLSVNFGTLENECHNSPIYVHKQSWKFNLRNENRNLFSDCNCDSQHLPTVM